MPRRALVLSDIFPYHITIKTNNSDYFGVSMTACWNIFLDKLLILTYMYGFQIHSFVLMSNHYHLVVGTPDKNLSSGLRYLHTEVCKDLNLLEGRSNHQFGGRYSWKLIDDMNYYKNALKYVYRNPVRAGLVDRVERYQYSTLNGILGLSILKVPIYDPYDLSDFTSNEALDWLNSPFKIERESQVQRYLANKPVSKTPGGYLF